VTDFRPESDVAPEGEPRRDAAAPPEGTVPDQPAPDQSAPQAGAPAETAPAPDW